VLGRRKGRTNFFAPRRQPAASRSVARTRIIADACDKILIGQQKPTSAELSLARLGLQ
jgi:hypothetical protein